MLARVLKEGLTDTAQIAVRDWVALDAEHRRAIETRLDHNAAGTELEPNPTLVDQLATEMTQAPSAFARRDLVPAVAHLPLPQWQRFRDWQAGIKRNDPAVEDQRYAIKRGLQLANKMLPADAPDDDAVYLRAALVEEIDTWRRVNGKSPDDSNLAGMLARHVPTGPHTTHMLEWDPRVGPEARSLRFVPSPAPQTDRRIPPGVSLHNIVMPLDPQTAQRLAALPGQVIDELLLLFMMWMLMNSIILSSQTDKLARPQSPPVPILPSEKPDDEASTPSSDPAEPRSTKPSSSPPPPPPIPPPPASVPGQQPGRASGTSTPPPGGSGSHPLEQILRPGGRPVGQRGTNRDTRMVTKAEIADIESRLRALSGQPGVYDPRYGGEWFTVPGGRIGIRMSDRFGRTIDVDHPLFRQRFKIHHTP